MLPKKYDIPKKRRTVRTIKMSNGSILTAEVDDSTNKLYWFRDGKYITPSVMKNYTFYDSKIKSRRRLDAYPELGIGAGKVEATGANTPVYTPSLDYLEKRQRDKEDIAIENESSQEIPWSEDIITLKTSGRMNLADIPISELDSIAVNSGRSNTPIKQNLGLVGKESTFGGYSHLLKKDNASKFGLDPHLLTNNHAYYKTPEEDYISASYKKYDYDNEQGVVAAEKDALWNIKNNNIVDRTPHYSHYIMADAFKRYAEAPNKYNPGQGNYVPIVNAIGEEVWSDPQIQQWWSTQGKAQYEKGQKEGMAYGGPIKTPWNNLSIADKAAMMEVAVRNGITDLNEIRQKYNEFAKGGDISGENYYEIMERVAKENWQKWGDPSEDAALTRILNSNDYNYREYYNKYPDSQANADTHWTDEFKTRWHPTFSVESKYSGEKSEYNPEGYVGGMWLEDAFLPQAWQVAEENKKEEENLFDRGGTKKQAFLSSLDQSLKEDKRFDNAQWRQFFTDLANMESGYSPNITNSIGAKGYFQLMPSNRAGAWKNPTQQFHEMYKLTGNNLNYLNKNLTQKDWEKAEALGIDMYGMLAGAHLGGAGNVLKALRGKGNAKDMNGTSVMKYMTKFSQKGAVPTLATPTYYEDAPTALFTPSNPEVFFGGYKAPEIEAPLPSVELEETPQYSEEEIARQERRERLNNLSMLMSLTSPQGSNNSMLDAIGLLMR